MAVFFNRYYAYHTGGTQRVLWWYATLFQQYDVFHNSVLKVLIPLLKLFKLLTVSFLDCWCNLLWFFFLPVFPSFYKTREWGANIMGGVMKN
jgi:hypothetical protein